MTDPIMVECEGSGCPAHPHHGFVARGICSMCGESVPLNGMVALLHARKDIIAMLKRGDFDD